MRPRSKTKPTTINEYLAGLSDDKRAALERLRKIIRAAVPRAEEHISYQMPAFRLDGKWLVYFAAGADHCAIYGLGQGHEGELDAYDTSGRGTIRFRPDAPLPAALVRKLLKARMATNAAKKPQGTSRR